MRVEPHGILLTHRRISPLHSGSAQPSASGWPKSARWIGLALLPFLLGAAPYDKVIILGFDGADAALVERYMTEGRLPHLKALRDEGFYAPLRPTNPPQTPVSWATFTTGLNPGRTEVFDFLRRTEGTYLPEFAMIKTGRRPLLFGANNKAVFASIAALGLGLGVFAV